MNQTVARAPRTQLPGAQWLGGQFVNWGTPVRSDRKILKGTLTIAAMGASMMGAFAAGVTIFPAISGLASAPFYGVAYFLERMKNGVQATDEMEFRAKFYTKQIYVTLGMQQKPGKYASVSEFKQAAEINTELKKFYDAPLREKASENKKSLLVNGGLIGASALTGAGGALAGAAATTHKAIEGIKLFGEAGKVAGMAKGALQAAAVMGRDGAGQLAGGAVAKVLSHDKVDPHAIVEALDKSITEAREKGMDVAEVADPKLIFSIRVAQDEKFGEQLKSQFGKPFHKLDVQKQEQVMAAYPALANAVTSEASAIKLGILSVKELSASKPNLNATASQYAVGGGRNSSFAARLQAQRAAAPQGFGAAV